MKENARLKFEPDTLRTQRASGSRDKNFTVHTYLCVRACICVCLLVVCVCVCVCVCVWMWTITSVSYLQFCRLLYVQSECFNKCIKTMSSANSVCNSSTHYAFGALYYTITNNYTLVLCQYLTIKYLAISGKTLLFKMHYICVIGSIDTHIWTNSHTVV